MKSEAVHRPVIIEEVGNESAPCRHKVTAHTLIEIKTGAISEQNKDRGDLADTDPLIVA